MSPYPQVNAASSTHSTGSPFRPTPDELNNRHRQTITANAAAAYAQLGLKVMPIHGLGAINICTCKSKEKCIAAGKHPKRFKWDEFATNDPDEARRLFMEREHFWANIGIVTGEKSGVFVIDVDGEDGMRDLADLEQKLGPLPQTMRARSGSGKGSHIYVRWPAEGKPIRSRTKLHDTHIDVRGNGGQIVAPGSRHKSGNCYEFLPGCAPDETEFAELPPAWLEWIRKADKENSKPAPAPSPQVNRVRPAMWNDDWLKILERARKYLEKMEPSVSGQKGHDKAFAAARALVWGFNLSIEDALRLLLEYFNPRCSPAWTEKELRRKCQDADTKPFGKPRGYLLGDNRPRPLPVTAKGGDGASETDMDKIARMAREIFGETEEETKEEVFNNPPAVKREADLLPDDLPTITPHPGGWPKCPNETRPYMRHTKKRKGGVWLLPCRCHTCAGCGPYKLAMFVHSMAAAIREEARYGTKTFYVYRCDDKHSKLITDSIRDKGNGGKGRYARVRGEYFSTVIISTKKVASEHSLVDEVSAQEAIARLQRAADDVDLTQKCTGQTLTHSREWTLLYEHDEDYGKRKILRLAVSTLDRYIAKAEKSDTTVAEMVRLILKAEERLRKLFELLEPAEQKRQLQEPTPLTFGLDLDSKPTPFNRFLTTDRDGALLELATIREAIQAELKRISNWEKDGSVKVNGTLAELHEKIRYHQPTARKRRVVESKIPGQWTSLRIDFDGVDGKPLVDEAALKFHLSLSSEEWKAEKEIIRQRLEDWIPCWDPPTPFSSPPAGRGDKSRVGPQIVGVVGRETVYAGAVDDF